MSNKCKLPNHMNAVQGAIEGICRIASKTPIDDIIILHDRFLKTYKDAKTMVDDPENGQYYRKMIICLEDYFKRYEEYYEPYNRFKKLLAE